MEIRLKAPITVTFILSSNFKQVEGDIFPEAELPENARKLRGFVWRGDERIKTKDDIFPPEENELDAKIQADKKLDMEKADTPLEPRKETLDYDKKNPIKKTAVK